MTVAEQTQSTHVAPLLPSTAEMPLPARRVGFLRGFLLFWLLPRRYGPHLAARSMWLALAAHGLAVLLSALVILAVVVMKLAPSDGFDLHQTRVFLAEQVLDLAAQTSTLWPLDWIVVALVVLAVPLAELVLVFLAILLMPWCAGGDSARSVFRRSLKNVYWTTTTLLPLTILWSAIVLLLNDKPDFLRSRFDILILSLLMLSIGVSITVVFRALLVGASRYAGEPDGPAFRPREPHCDACGYLIVGLPLASPCPECALPVGESLPGGRRRPTAWQQHELSSSGFRDLLATQWRVLREPAFFQRLPVQNGLRTARHFWWGTFMLLVLAGLLVVRLLLFAVNHWDAEAFPALAALFVLLPIVAQMLMMFGACLFSQVAYGIRDYRVSATTCYYASPLMWPAAVIVFVIFVVAMHAGMNDWGETPVYLLEYTLPLAGVVMIGLAVVLAGCGLFWWSRLLRALRDVRYANV